MPVYIVIGEALEGAEGLFTAKFSIKIDGAVIAEGTAPRTYPSAADAEKTARMYGEQRAFQMPDGLCSTGRRWRRPSV